jgi:hypothetical protein
MQFQKIIRMMKSAPTLSPHSRAFRASSERSEGSVAMGNEMLRCAQHDSAVTLVNAWINLLICIIGGACDTSAPTVHPPGQKFRSVCAGR